MCIKYLLQSWKNILSFTSRKSIIQILAQVLYCIIIMIIIIIIIIISSATVCLHTQKMKLRDY